MSGEMNCVSLLPEIATIDLDQIDLFFIESLYYDKEYCIRFLMHTGLLKKDKMCCGRSTSLTKKESVKYGYISTVTTVQSTIQYELGLFLKEAA